MFRGEQRMRIKDTGYPIYTYPQISGNKKPAQTDAARKSGKSGLSLSAESLKHANRTDKIELNCRSTQLDTSLISLKENLCEEINADADPSRLQDLKNAVENGNYSLDPGALADILLFDKFDK
jgi:anti-sigma28 factor (negative regulator of flagellin synthesis)